MSDLIKDIFKDISSWSLIKVIICTCSAFVIYTLINVYAPKKLSRALNAITLFGIVATIGFYTISNRAVKTNRSVRLIPFKRLFTAKHPSFKTLWQNAFLFFPFGLSMPYVLPERLRLKRRLLLTLISAAAFSLCIELSQLVFKLGHFETDDVIMNTFGAAIGTLSYAAAVKLRERHDRIRQVIEPSADSEDEKIAFDSGD